MLKHPWSSGNIEILFVDLSKSWDLNDFVIDQWFPALLPGAYLVQQDYFSWYTYWLPITMEALSDCFEYIDYAFGGSAVYRCIKPVTPGTSARIRNLSFPEMEALFDRAILRSPAPGAEVLKAAKGCFYLAFGDRERSLAILESVNTEQLTLDPSVNFYGVATGSRDILRACWHDPALAEFVASINPPYANYSGRTSLERFS